MIRWETPRENELVGAARLTVALLILVSLVLIGALVIYDAMGGETTRPEPLVETWDVPRPEAVDRLWCLPEASLERYACARQGCICKGDR
jgi:hypothetical protein